MKASNLNMKKKAWDNPPKDEDHYPGSNTGSGGGVPHSTPKSPGSKPRRDQRTKDDYHAPSQLDRDPIPGDTQPEQGTGGQGHSGEPDKVDNIYPEPSNWLRPLKGLPFTDEHLMHDFNEDFDTEYNIRQRGLNMRKYKFALNMKKAQEVPKWTDPKFLGSDLYDFVKIALQKYQHQIQEDPTLKGKLIDEAIPLYIEQNQDIFISVGITLPIMLEAIKEAANLLMVDDKTTLDTLPAEQKAAEIFPDPRQQTSKVPQMTNEEGRLLGTYTADQIWDIIRNPETANTPEGQAAKGLIEKGIVASRLNMKKKTSLKNLYSNDIVSAKNPNTPLYTLMGFAQDPQLRPYVAQNPSISLEMFYQFAVDESADVRNYLATNPKVPVEILERLMLDKITHVRGSVAHSPNITPEMLRQLYDNSANDLPGKNVPKDYNYVRNQISSSPYTPVDMLIQIFNEENLPWTQLGHLSLNAHLPAEMLIQLATHPNVAIRKTLTENVGLPIEALKILANDENDHVRMNVSLNINTPPELLQQLSNDPHRSTQYYAKMALNEPDKIMRCRLDDPLISPMLKKWRPDEYHKAKEKLQAEVPSIEDLDEETEVPRYKAERLPLPGEEFDLPENLPPGIASRLNMKRIAIKKYTDLFDLEAGMGISTNELYDLYAQINKGNYDTKLIDQVFFGLLSAAEQIIQNAREMQDKELEQLYTTIVNNLQNVGTAQPEQKFMEIDKITHLWHTGNPLVMHMLNDWPDVVPIQEFEYNIPTEEEMEKFTKYYDTMRNFISNLPGHTAYDPDEDLQDAYKTPFREYSKVSKLNMKKQSNNFTDEIANQVIIKWRQTAEAVGVDAVLERFRDRTEAYNMVMADLRGEGHPENIANMVAIQVIDAIPQILQTRGSKLNLQKKATLAVPIRESLDYFHSWRKRKKKKKKEVVSPEEKKILQMDSNKLNLKKKAQYAYDEPEYPREGYDFGGAELPQYTGLTVIDIHPEKTFREWGYKDPYVQQDIGTENFPELEQKPFINVSKAIRAAGVTGNVPDPIKLKNIAINIDKSLLPDGIVTLFDYESVLKPVIAQLKSMGYIEESYEQSNYYEGGSLIPGGEAEFDAFATLRKPEVQAKKASINSIMDSNKLNLKKKAQWDPIPKDMVKEIYEFEYKRSQTQDPKYQKFYTKMLNDSLNIALPQIQEIFSGWHYAHTANIFPGDFTEKEGKTIEAVGQMANELQKYAPLSVGEKIILFHQALNLAHTSGTMAGYIIHPNTIPEERDWSAPWWAEEVERSQLQGPAKAFLTDLSTDKYIAEWDKDLRREVDSSRKASILDEPRASLDEAIWDIGEDDLPMLKPNIKIHIVENFLSYVSKFGGYIKPEEFVKNLFYTGSTATRRFKPESDVDIHVVVDWVDMAALNPDKARKDPNEMWQALHDTFWWTLNKQKLLGKHPLTYYVVKPGEEKKILEAKEEIYDIGHDCWLIPPGEVIGLPQEAMMVATEEASEIMARIEEHLANARKGIMDYDMLQILEKLNDGNTPIILQRFDETLKTLDKELVALKDEYALLKQKRQEGFDTGKPIAPTESKNYTKGNIIFKLVERFKLMEVLREIKRITDARPIKHDQVGDIADALGFEDE